MDNDIIEINPKPQIYHLSHYGIKPKKLEEKFTFLISQILDYNFGSNEEDISGDFEIDGQLANLIKMSGKKVPTEKRIIIPKGIDFISLTLKIGDYPQKHKFYFFSDSENTFEKVTSFISSNKRKNSF